MSWLGALAEWGIYMADSIMGLELLQLRVSQTILRWHVIAAGRGGHQACDESSVTISAT